MRPFTLDVAPHVVLLFSCVIYDLQSRSITSHLPTNDTATPNPHQQWQAAHPYRLSWLSAQFCG